MTGAPRSACSSSTCSTWARDSAEAALLTTDPNAFYQAARRKFDNDPAFTERARAPAGAAAGRGPGHDGHLAAAGRHLPGVPASGLHPARGEPDRRRHPRRELLQRPARGHRRDLGGEGHRDRERRRAVRLSRRASPAARASRCRSSSARATAATTTPPPTWPRSATGSTSSASTGRSTWSAPSRPCTSRWSSRWPGKPAGSPTACASSTPRSAWCSARTAAGSGPGKARHLSSAACSTRASTGPAPSWTRWTRPPASTRPNWTRWPRRSASAR